MMGLLALCVPLFFYFGLGRMTSLSSLQENKDLLQSYTQSHYTAMVICYLC